MNGMDGKDGKDDNQGMDSTDRRQGWNQDPSGSTQDGRDEQAGYQPTAASASRETPAILPGRFLRNPAPPIPQRTSIPLIPAEDATPTRSVPVLSRPGYPPSPPSLGTGGPTPSTPAPSADVERASATPGSGYGQDPASAQQPVSTSSLPRGAYVVEETQEMVVTPAAGPSSPASSPAPSWPGSGFASPPAAAGAAPVVYPQPEQTGSYSEAQPEPAGRYGDMSSRAASDRQNGIAASGPDRGAAWTGSGPGSEQAPGRSAGEGQSSSWRRQDNWQQSPAARAGSYSASPPPAAARGHQQQNAAGGAGGTPHVPQRARAGGLAQAATSLLGPEEDQGTVAILLTANHAAALSYLFGFLSGIFFYFGERENRYLRFHAMQSIILSSFMIVVGVVVYLTALIERIRVDDPVWNAITLAIALIVVVALAALWLWTMAKAWMGHYVFLPIISLLAVHFATPHAELVQDQGV